MKKIIAISVMFVLLTGAAFAVDISGTVIGTVNVLQSDTGKNGPPAGESTKVTSSAELNRIRIDGSGEVADGVFGGYFRYNNGDFFGNAWWKPIDQFKLLIGSNGGDGFIGKEGVTGWMFQQTVYDTGVAYGSGNIWGGGYANVIYRDAFYAAGVNGSDAVYLFITPVDIASVNIILPFFVEGPTETADVFKKAVAQVDLHLDFGNIALTYVSGLGYNEEKGIDDPGQIFLYYGGTFDALSIDFGLGYKLANHDPVTGDSKANPIGVGLGVKYVADALGVKFRAVAGLAGDKKETNILAEVLPYFNLGDKLTAFVSVGLGMIMPEEGDSTTAWHFNPYLQVGEEWGAKFLAGIKVWSLGKDSAGDSITNWAVPIALIVSF